MEPECDIVIYLKAFQWLLKITDIVKLRSFQYHLLLGKVFVNNTLVHWKKVDSSDCELCKLPIKQTICHLMYNCFVLKKFWNEVVKLFDTSHQPTLNLENIMWNCIHPVPDHCTNVILLAAKQYIYSRKCLQAKLHINEFIRETVNLARYNIEKNYKDIRKKEVTEKWNPVLSTVRNFETRIL